MNVNYHEQVEITCRIYQTRIIITIQQIPLIEISSFFFLRYFFDPLFIIGFSLIAIQICPSNHHGAVKIWSSIDN